MSKPAPIDWNGLLQWSSQYHDGTRPASDFKPLSGEDKKFLEGAMAQAFGEVEDYNELMQDAINKISTDFDNSDTVYTALEVVDKCCDNLDVPRNLHLFGGIEVMLKTLEHPNEDIACKGASLFALMLQNNEEIQKLTDEAGALDKIYKFSDRDENCLFRALGLASALIRNESALEEKFVSGPGSALLTRSLATDHVVRVRTKGVNLLRWLLIQQKIKGEAVNQFAIALAECVALDYDNLNYGDSVANTCSALWKLAPSGDAGSKLKAAAAARKTVLATDADWDDRSVEIELLKELEAAPVPVPSAAPAAPAEPVGPVLSLTEQPNNATTGGYSSKMGN